MVFQLNDPIWEKLYRGMIEYSGSHINPTVYRDFRSYRIAIQQWFADCGVYIAVDPIDDKWSTVKIISKDHLTYLLLRYASQ